MEPLITLDDLAARGLDPLAASEASINAASAAVRDAAGVPISAETVTVTVPGTCSYWLPIPGPTTAVTAVSIDGVAIAATDYRVWPSRLWREGGWGAAHIPVVISMTFGLAAVPEDIKQLVCELSIMASAATATDPRVQSESIDDYRVTYAGGTVSTIELPERTRALLRARFSGSAAVTGSHE